MRSGAYLPVSGNCKKTKKMEKFSKNWLFGDHSQSQVYKWISTLNYFLFFRAIGGHANDGDYFEMRIKFIRPNDQATFLNALKLSDKSFKEPTTIILNEPFSKFNCTISEKELVVTLVGTSGNPYKMSDIEYDLCVEFEKLIDQINFKNNVSFDHKRMPTCITLDTYADCFN